ncbi:MAG: bacterioferritin-associated ferredoxin [Parvularculaceae bacterium]
MYICICNALKDRQIKAEASGAKSVGEVFRRCGTRPQCGKCLPDIAKMIEEARGCETSRIAAE